MALKAGSSTLSARTAAGHTGALVGDDRVINAVFADLGIIRVDSIEDMLIAAGAAAALGRLRNQGIGIVSISGGACDIVADRADDLGAALPELAPSTRDALAAIMPPYGTVQNPLDVTGTEAGGHTGTIATMVLTPEIVDIAAGCPVLAAGGIASGRQMAAALALGAAGVWCGSVWLSSQRWLPR